MTIENVSTGGLFHLRPKQSWAPGTVCENKAQHKP